VHKDQRFAAKPRRAAPAARVAGHGEDEASDADHQPSHAATRSKAPPTRALVLKWLFLVVAVSLMISTCLGIWMAVTSSRRKGVVWSLLALGAALPVLILVI
jgi:hypothetical protein